MNPLPTLAIAFSAGMLASINPCGFAMLPAFLSYQLRDTRNETAADEVNRILPSLRLSELAALGFMTVFLGVGTALTLGGRALVGLVVGVLLVGLGLWSLLSQRSLPLQLPMPRWDYRSRTSRNMLLFGIAYGIASLGCTLPVFLAIVSSALALQSLATTVAVFFSYSLGMGIVLAAAALSAALFQGIITRSLKRMMPYVHTISALALIGAGLYLIYFQIFVSPFLRGGL